MTKPGRSHYAAEIASMLFVFSEVKDPDEETVKMIEDVVRAQIVELIIQARALATKRGSRTISSEDLIFLTRHDRSKVNRLRTYLSWKEVRKRAKDTDAVDAGEVDVMDEQITTDKSAKAHKMRIKLPWEITTVFSDMLPDDSDAEEDEDDRIAYEDSKKRLRLADEHTRNMTREEYAHYAECRQASFVYRKGKRFREFIGYNTYVEGNPNDEVIDILGFLSYELVRAVCEQASQVHERSAALRIGLAGQVKTKLRSDSMESRKSRSMSVGARRKRARSDSHSPDVDFARALPLPPAGPFAPSDAATYTPSGEDTLDTSTTAAAQPSGATKRPARYMIPNDVETAYAEMQRSSASKRSSGLLNFRGGLVRNKLALL
ncbi:uncharacterized protein L969DRAFT_89521 [Mixia osmundae IAM 14324]|uniref:uncharacterized protein n=1 Tax=Mixia osmundae (strain CBS 9802 / IAM 14324 / JCM 22182 / KY 12970) TaxID=764103 RepID=UPI0004A54FDA|nr:uncharacterized protein L969DRAFT_89521 [Mixia osmundae IAM 14324]KEI37571.1 hypothetical protein L969DRAFT_89521 [Mixia osmundae IAM 14324]